ncbi:MAG: hypothetical protein IT204_24205 [Fimbriimonadaceae bacterium]|nr:hypothetical protein [Fimbriimonadaceae bacterium]
MRTWWWLLCLLTALPAQELPSLSGWRPMFPTGESHVAGLDLARPHGGRGAGFLRGSSAENGARACFIQEFIDRTALPTDREYRWEVHWRTTTPLAGRAAVLIDTYTAAGESSHRALVQQNLAPAAEWQQAGGRFTVLPGVVRVRLLLYLHGVGQVWYDDAFLGDATADAPNRLRNPGFEPPDSHVWDLAPARGRGQVKLSADFPNGALGAVKEVGDEEFYLYTVPPGRPRPPFLWFHFRVDGCRDKEVTFHLNPAPFSRETTAGNGTRLPVLSYDGDRWEGVTPTTWNDDGTTLTWTCRFTSEPAWIASFYPYTAAQVDRFVEAQRGHPAFAVEVLGPTREGRELRCYRITDPQVAEAGKQALIFTTLQHDLETTGAHALEGLLRFWLSEDPRAQRLRRQFVLYAVPQMNPDGIAAGNLYHPAGNLNRQWGLGTAPETTAVEKLAQRLAAQGLPLALTMDFHGWSREQRQTLLMTPGAELTDPATAAAAQRLIDQIRPRLQGSLGITFWKQMVSYVTMGETDLRRLAVGWLQFDGRAKLAFTVEIFGEGTATQDDYHAWGRTFAEGIAAWSQP